MPLLIGTPLILVSLWIVANDPTLQTWSRRRKLEAQLRAPSREAQSEDVKDLIAVFPEMPSDLLQRHNRRRVGGRIKSSFRRKPSYQKRKTR
jgi:hypothetical protein